MTNAPAWRRTAHEEPVGQRAPRRWRGLIAPTFATLATALLLAAALEVGSARADEAIFGYTRLPETLPKDGKEVELWITNRRDKGEGSYSATDYRAEFEYGFTDRLTGAFYLNGRQHRIAGVPGLEDRTQTRFDGVSAELKYYILSAYKDGFGLGLYFEPGYSRYSGRSGDRRTEYELETKLLLQKNFLDDQLIWGGNLNLELAREKEADEVEGEAVVSLQTGLAYRFAPGWYGGVEARYDAKYPELSRREAWALFAGPTLHYAAKSWWATLTWLPQIKGRPVDSAVSSRLHLDEFEKQEIRLRVGYFF